MSGAGGDPPFAVESVLIDGVGIVAVSGYVDLSTAPALRDELESTSRESAAVVVDLCAATFIDSSGLNVLISARRTLTTREGVLAIAYASGTQPAQLFEMVAGDQLFALFTSRAAAIQAVR